MGKGLAILQDYHNQIHHLRAVVGERDATIHNERAARAAIEASLAIAQHVAAEQTAQAQLLTQRIAELQGALDGERAALAAAREDVKRARAVTAGLKPEVDALRAENARLTRQIDALSRQIDRLLA